MVCSALDASRDASEVRQLKLQFQALQLDAAAQKQQVQQQEQEIATLQQRVHRLEHTVTSAAEVGDRVLQRAAVDSAASFLPGLMQGCLTEDLIAHIPATVFSKLDELKATLRAKRR